MFGFTAATTLILYPYTKQPVFSDIAVIKSFLGGSAPQTPRLYRPLGGGGRPSTLPLLRERNGRAATAPVAYYFKVMLAAVAKCYKVMITAVAKC